MNGATADHHPAMDPAPVFSLVRPLAEDSV